jgi:hypothetical protein
VPVPLVVVKIADAIPVALAQGESLSIAQLSELAGALGASPVVEELLALFPDLVLTRLFDTLSPDEMQQLVAEAAKADRSYVAPSFEHFLEVECPPDFDTGPLVAAFNLWLGVVETAYTETISEDAQVVGTTNPDFGRQEYLQPGPVGVGAQSAWAQGLDGSGVRLIDIEHAWLESHEDLPVTPLLAGINRTTSRGHGAGVLGVIAAIDNAVGVVGLSPNVSIRRLGVQDAGRTPGETAERVASKIALAASRLSAGDILLLEIQGGGGPIERTFAIFEAIKVATAKGIIVVEAAGNGGHDLDTLIDERGLRGLARSIPSEFRNSGAILVGGCRGLVPHTRLGSCFGSRIDCYAWAESVWTTGHPDPVTPTSYFNFSGTSSAAAIIAGVCALVQHAQRSLIGSGTSTLRPAEMQRIVSAEANGTRSLLISDAIGVMPDLAKILANEFS